MIQAVPNVRAMASYELADLGDPKAVSLAQNESLRGPSPLALAAGRDALAQSELYPDPDWRDLRQAIAAVHSVDIDTILCGAGSMELIGVLIRSFTGPGDSVVTTQYGYAFLATAAQQSGAAYIAAPETDYRVCVDAVLAAVQPSTRLVCICNPGNPTGTCIPNADILRLRDALADDVLLLVDQAYAEFDAQDAAPIFDLIKRGDTVVTRTMSKAYGLAGARAGWALAAPVIGSEMRKLLNPNNISGTSQAMAAAAMRDQAYMRATVAETNLVRDRFTAGLRAAGFDLPDSATNFALIPFTDQAAAQRANAALIDRGYILRGMDGYGLPHCLRVTVGASEHMEAVAAIIKETA